MQLMFCLNTLPEWKLLNKWLVLQFQSNAGTGRQAKHRTEVVMTCPPFRIVARLRALIKRDSEMINFSWHETYNKNFAALVHEPTIPTERPPPVGKVSANFCGQSTSISLGQRNRTPHILGFLDRIRYFFFQAAPQLYSQSWVDPVPDSLLLRKSGSAGNRTRVSWSVGKTIINIGGLL
jgi:hypothetical protein